MTSPQLPDRIVIYPDPSQNRWRFSVMGRATGFACGDFDLPSSVGPDEVRQAAEALLTELGPDLYDADLTITWQPPDTKGWIGGDIKAASQPA